MREKSVAILLGISGLLLPSVAFAAPRTFSELVGLLLNYINLLIPLIIAGAVVLYMKNTATGIFNLSKGKVDPDWQKGMFWGIVILALMVSIWGVLSVIGRTLGF